MTERTTSAVDTQNQHCQCVRTVVDSCCPTRASFSASPEDKDSGVLREQGVCGVCGEVEVAAAAGAVGLVWTVYEMACFLTLSPSLRWSTFL